MKLHFFSVTLQVIICSCVEATDHYWYTDTQKYLHHIWGQRTEVVESLPWKTFTWNLQVMSSFDNERLLLLCISFHLVNVSTWRTSTTPTFLLVWSTVRLTLCSPQQVASMDLFYQQGNPNFIWTQVHYWIQVFKSLLDAINVLMQLLIYNL